MQVNQTPPDPDQPDGGLPAEGTRRDCLSLSVAMVQGEAWGEFGAPLFVAMKEKRRTPEILF
jgi:hypothetical protein